jgi:hypothetical protein
VAQTLRREFLDGKTFGSIDDAPAQLNEGAGRSCGNDSVSLAKWPHTVPIPLSAPP